VTPAQVRKVEQEIGNLTDAIASGILKSSPAIAERLHATETELARLRAAQVRKAPDLNIENIVTGLEARYERLICDLDDALLDRHGERGRQALRSLLGAFKVDVDVREIRFYNEQGRHEAALLRAVGAEARNCGRGGALRRLFAAHSSLMPGLDRKRADLVRQRPQHPCRPSRPGHHSPLLIDSTS
jgi:hypothetical protein